MEARELIKLRRNLDVLNDKLFDMMDDVIGLQRDIQFLSYSIREMYDIIEEEEKKC